MTAVPNKKLSTDSYKGVRDFYPEDMAIQRYIFATWSKTAESFGYECYGASVLEPSDLYKAKGAENEEMINEQTYTFIDRGNREVTLRPEMTPTVARMVAGRQRELSFPVRWYSIPNLFRYERTQRGRLREHWQLNCDIFGVNDYTADVEIIALAYQIFINFGADPSLFEIHLNNRKKMESLYTQCGITDPDQQRSITRLNDRFDKIPLAEYQNELHKIVGDEMVVQKVIAVLQSENDEDDDVLHGLRELGITNVKINRSLARGFDYYTGTIFEFKDTAPENRRSLLGGGRYDNLTSLFSDDPIPGIGFGFGDVTMRDFLETHGLLTANITAPTLMIIPTETTYNLEAQKIAQTFRTSANLSVATDISTKKLSKKIGTASDKLVDYIIVVGENEVVSKIFTLKHLRSNSVVSGAIDDLVNQFVQTVAE